MVIVSREPGSAEVRYSEASMRNGFGLKLIHKFFNLPFLQLQRETLLKQLETNNEENFLTIQELNFYLESDDADYDLYVLFSASHFSSTFHCLRLGIPEEL